MPAIRLYRHPDCAKCARYARLHHRLDWFGRFQDTTGISPVGPLRLGEIVVQDLRSGTTLRGAAGFDLLCRQIPAYGLLLPFLRISALRRRIDREWRGCSDAGCTID